MKFYEKIIGIDATTKENIEIGFGEGLIKFQAPIRLKSKESALMLFEETDVGLYYGIDNRLEFGKQGSKIQIDFLNKRINFTIWELIGLEEIVATKIRIKDIYPNSSTAVMGTAENLFFRIYNNELNVNTVIPNNTLTGTLGTIAKPFNLLVVKEMEPGTFWGRASNKYYIPGVKHNASMLQIRTFENDVAFHTQFAYGQVTTSTSSVNTTVVFSSAFGVPPRVVVTPRQVVGGIAYHVSNVTTDNFTLTLGDATTAKKFDWVAIGH